MLLEPMNVFHCVCSKSKTYKLCDINAKVIIESNGVELYEDKFPFKLRNSGDT